MAQQRSIKLPGCMLFCWTLLFVLIGIFIAVWNMCSGIPIVYKLLFDIVIVVESYNEFYNSLSEKIIYENRPIRPRNDGRHH